MFKQEVESIINSVTNIKHKAILRITETIAKGKP